MIGWSDQSLQAACRHPQRAASRTDLTIELRERSSEAKEAYLQGAEAAYLTSAETLGRLIEEVRANFDAENIPQVAHIKGKIIKAKVMIEALAAALKPPAHPERPSSAAPPPT